MEEGDARLSAGRVQSVATRLVVERERERMAFTSAEYWDLLGTFEPGAFEARLVAVDGARVAQGRDFARRTAARARPSSCSTRTRRGRSRTGSRAHVHGRLGRREAVPRKPAAPFRTATLQQEASRKLRFSAQTTMRVAQRLYESGLHHLHAHGLDDAVRGRARRSTRARGAQLFGDEFVPEKPRRYGRAVANAQEAHEAIRPAGDSSARPRSSGESSAATSIALYDLVWKRTLASQMEDASGQTVSLRDRGDDRSTGEDAEFGASGTVITFRGFLAGVRARPRRALATDDEERVLPRSTVGQDAAGSRRSSPRGTQTSPPARYTEPTLVRALEERGIGRPSTYAAILSTIVDRGYVFKKGTALVPTFVAFAVVNLLERHFDAARRLRLHRTAWRTTSTGSPPESEERVDWLTRFYFGDGRPRASITLVTDHLDEIDARAVNSIAIPGHRRRRARGPLRAVPRAWRAAREPPRRPRAGRAHARRRSTSFSPSPTPSALGTHPESGHEIVVRTDGRYGPVRDRGPPGGRGRQAANRVALLVDVARDDLARRRVAPAHAPPVVGEIDGEEVTAQNGRYGPYVKKGSESRSLESRGAAVHGDARTGARRSSRSRRSAAGAVRRKPPLKELGADPQSGRPIVVRDGRFGPYVTDGETNASLRRGDTPEGITLERAVELLAERRAKSE